MIRISGFWVRTLLGRPYYVEYLRVYCSILKHEELEEGFGGVDIAKVKSGLYQGVMKTIRSDLLITFPVPNCCLR